MASMFSKPKTPKAAEPKVIPMAVPEEAAAANKKARAKASSTGGRQSTMLSDGDTLG